MQPINVDDATDPRLSDYRDLRHPDLRRRRERDEFFVAEGFVAVRRLLASGHRVRSVVVSDKKAGRIDELGESSTLRSVPVYVVPQATLERVAGYDVHRGVLAAADRRPLPDLDTVLASSRRVAVLEGLNDPENLGAIARSARGLGIDALVIDPTCTDPYYRRTVRVSMGEILFLPVARATAWPDDVHAIVAAGFEVWALTPDDDADDIWSRQPPERLALLLGAEGPGLSPATMDRATARVRIPMARTTASPTPSTSTGATATTAAGRIDSLNVGHAAAVAFAVVNRPRSEGVTLGP